MILIANRHELHFRIKEMFYILNIEIFLKSCIFVKANWNEQLKLVSFIVQRCSKKTTK